MSVITIIKSYSFAKEWDYKKGHVFFGKIQQVIHFFIHFNIMSNNVIFILRNSLTYLELFIVQKAETFY